MDHLVDLLERSRRAVARADYVQAAALAAEMEAALDALPKLRDPAPLQRLREMAAQNALFLAAARKGLRAAMRRLEEIRRVSAGGQTYDGEGRLSNLSTTARTRIRL